MLASAPRLRIRRPSPTTAEFTVTTLPPQTIAVRLLRFLLLLARLSLSLATLLLLHEAWASSPFAPASPYAAPLPLPLPMLGEYTPPPPETLLSLEGLKWSSHTVHASRAGQFFARLAASIPLPALLPAAVALLYVLSLRVYSEESLLVMRGLGVQTSESAKSYFAGTATRFIPTEKIQDILVNEAFRGFEVRYFLIVVVEGEEDLVVVFPGLMPKRRIVEAVWRGARECLYEGRDEKISSS
ncbi:hypothetical protein K4F52_000233 [Lecanicillium sp. MT-2017a]|nr:hypothetical protein K4F52_000233 [Lecanicillium sp. MT-2017a]